MTDAPYGMDPYVQQHPGAMYAASPYTSHVLYVPSGMHPGQQGQYGMMQQGQQQFSPQMGGQGQFQGARQGMMQQGGLPGAYGQPSSGSFGPVGGMASTVGMGFGQPQQGQSPFGNGMGSPTQQMGRGGFPASGGFGSGGFGNGLGLGGQQGEEGGQFGFNNAQGQASSDNAGQGNNGSNGSSAFFGSNLLYSSGN